MGFVLFALVAIVALLVIGFIVHLVKWLLILGLIVVAVVWLAGGVNRRGAKPR